MIIENGVTTIDDHAFWGCSSLTTITIPSSVTSIGMASFGQCIRLATVTIGSSTSSIGYHAFEECTSLTSIIVDETNQTFKSVDGVLISKNGTTILTYPAGKTETAYIIPSGVTSIGESAFYGCGGLTSVIIPDGVTSIGIGAFSGCSGLTSVIIPGGVTTIGGGAFADCSSLTSITVDESNPNYKSEDGVLLSKDGTTLITYPIGKTETAYIISDGVTTIDYSAFRGCSGLISVTIPSSMTSIGYHAFYGCSGLTSVTIPGSVTAIGDWAFAFCNSLTSITIGSGVTAIGGWAFYGCTDLSDVFCYAKDVPTTDNRAFSNSNVANATLHVPEGAVEAYKAAEPWNQFKEIVALSGEEFDPDGNGLIDDVEIDGIYYDLVIDSKEAIVKSNPNKYQGNVTIPETVKYGGITYNLTSIGRSAFVGCSDLTAIIIPNSVTAIDDYAFSACSGLTSVSIPNSVTAIGEGAFWGCSSLTTITIPDGVSTIDVGVFCYCSGLTAIIVDEANTSYKSVDGVLMSKDGTTLLAYPAGKPETAYVIPDGVTTIGDDAFASCSGLTAITIGSGITAIGKQAFCNCSGLTSIIIPSGVTSIEDEVFYGCSGLTSVTIPASVTSIGDDAFRMCSSLTDMFCRAKNVPTTGKNVFQRSNIANATLHVPAGSIEAYQTAKPWNQFMEIVEIEDPIVEIDGIYYNLNILAKTAEVTSNPNGYQGDVTIPETVKYGEISYSVTSISSEAFYQCSGLTSVTIPGSVTSIGIYTFSGCIGLTSITIPDGVTSIGDATFEFCSGLTSVDIPGSVTYIGEGAFAGCVSLTSVTIPGSVTSIGQEAFGGCSGLNSITIPNSLTSIGKAAFAWCGLTDVYCHAENVPTTEGDTFYGSEIANATLHVPGEAIEAYKAAEPWNQFKEIVVLDEPDPVMGDMDGDGLVDSRDVVALVKTILSGDFSVAGEWNDDGKMDISDVVMLVNYIMEMQTE